MNYNNYPPKGIDYKVKNIQNVLNQMLGFTNVDFYGRVLRGLDSDSKTLVPEVMISSTESKEVYYNDAKAIGGNVFFTDTETHTSKDGKLFTAKIKIVFMLNLNKIKTDPLTDSEAQYICVKLLQKIGAIEITAIETGLKKVLEGFNLQNIKLSDSRPYHIFSINGDLNYTFNCNH